MSIRSRLTALALAPSIVILLLHGFEWSMSEVAEQLGISKSTVQTHAERGLQTLRHDLGVEQ